MPVECRKIDEIGNTPFHDSSTENYLRAKYLCIMQNMEFTPYRVQYVISKPYLEIYQIQTPNGSDRFDLHYKAGGIFLPAKSISSNEHTEQILLHLNDLWMKLERNYITLFVLHVMVYLYNSPTL